MAVHRHQQRRPAEHADAVDVGARLQQQARHLGVALPAGPDQRAGAALVHLVDLGAAQVNEMRDALGVAAPGGPCERAHVVAVLGAHLGARQQQALGDVGEPIVAGVHERRPAVDVGGVDVVAPPLEDHLETLEVVLARGHHLAGGQLVGERVQAHVALDELLGHVALVKLEGRDERAGVAVGGRLAVVLRGHGGARRRVLVLVGAHDGAQQGWRVGHGWLAGWLAGGGLSGCALWAPASGRPTGAANRRESRLAS